LRVSREGRIKVFANVHAGLANLTDEYRNDHANRVAAGTSFLWYRILLRDTDGDSKLHSVELVVDDSAAAYGILRVVYGEHKAGPGG
jgi:hypothetical protein